jgi:hypothetical protein
MDREEQNEDQPFHFPTRLHQEVDEEPERTASGKFLRLQCYQVTAGSLHLEV